MPVETWIAVFVTVAAIALASQAVILIVLAFKLKRLSQDVQTVITELNASLMPRLKVITAHLEGVTADTRQMVARTRSSFEAKIEDVDDWTNETINLLRLRVHQFDRGLSEFFGALDQTKHSIKRILRVPANEVNAVVQAVRGGYRAYRSRPPVNRAA
jgi:uncharacterized protein YoxC